jgi:preprotein translocase subunit SecD
MTTWLRYTSAFIAALIGAAGCETRSSDPAQRDAALIEFRMVQDSPTDGSQQVTLSGEQLILAATPVISDADVRTVDPVVRSGQLILSIELTEEGQQRLRQATAENIGRRMAFLLDGRVRSAVLIAKAIGETPVQTAFDASTAEADSLETLILARWR